MASGQSLFDDVDLVLGGADTPQARSFSVQGTSSFNGNEGWQQSSSSGESLFGGPKMSVSMMELKEEGLLAEGGLVGEDTVTHGKVPISEIYFGDRPKVRPRTASATVSTSFSGTRQSGSLFDEVPDAGASWNGREVKTTHNTRQSNLYREPTDKPNQHSRLPDLTSLHTEDRNAHVSAKEESQQEVSHPHHHLPNTHRFHLASNSSKDLQVCGFLLLNFLTLVIWPCFHTTNSMLAKVTVFIFCIQ